MPTILGYVESLFTSKCGVYTVRMSLFRAVLPQVGCMQYFGIRVLFCPLQVGQSGLISYRVPSEPL